VSGQQFGQRGGIEPVEDQHLCAAEQRGVEREAGVLGGRADQRHRAALDERQEAVLLRAVEAMDLVYEQQRALSGARGQIGLGEGLLEVGDAREHRADCNKPHSHCVGEQPGDRGLAGPGRSPQDHRGQFARCDHPPDRSGSPGQMVLPDYFGECSRPQPVGQRCILARGIARGRGQVIGEQIGHRDLSSPSLPVR
jgi:hypothetical protein